MSNRFTYLICILFFAGFLYGQNAELDSLKELLKTDIGDTTRVDILISLAEKTRFSAPAESAEYSQKAYDLATELEDLDRQGWALKFQGMAAEGQGDYIRAMEYYQQSLEFFRQAGNLDGESNILNNLGSVYNTGGDDVKALENFLASLRTAEQIDDPKRIGTAKLNIGSVYMKKPQTAQKAIQSLEDAVPFFEKANYPVGSGVAFINLGEIFLGLNQLDSSIHYLEKARQIFLDSPGYLSYTLNLIGEAQTHQGNFQAAIATQQEAIRIGQQTSNKLQEAHALRGLADTYLASGSHSIAISNYLMAEELYGEMGTKDGLKDVYRGLATSYAGINDYENAFEYHTLYSNYKDTLYNIDAADELKHLQFGYDLEKKESEIALLNKENDLQQAQIQKAKVLRNFSIALVAFLMIIAAGVFVQFRIQKKSKERKQALEQQQQVNEQLKQIDKLKDQFLANTSHELRTPLNGIIGLADSLKDGVAGPLPRKAIDNLDMIASSGRRLANLVNDILDFSKLKGRDLHLNLRPVDMHTAVNIVLRLSEPMIREKEIELINDMPRDVPLVNADENRLQQILHNVIGNAIKFTDEGSVRISSEVRDDMLALAIKDSGIGIPKDKFDSIFQSFEQGDGDTAREYGGTGLGLSVSKSLVELHGGGISVESEQGEGSIFTITLPLSGVERSDMGLESQEEVLKGVEFGDEPEVSQPVMEDMEVGPTAMTPMNGDPISVLVVDDEPVNRQVLENHLSIAGYKVTQAADGNEALKILDGDERFDLILLDIMMPKMSGYEVCNVVRQNYLPSELPVVMLTAKNQVNDLVQGFKAGANDYLTKPFAKDELLSRIKTHVNLHHINRATGKFVPSEFLRVLGRDAITEIRLGDHHEQEVTVLFSDIRSYTSLAETMGPEDNFRFVNAYNKRMGPIIQEHGGFVNQYLGDGIMAIFTEKGRGPVQASIDMQLAIQLYNEKRKKDGRVSIKVGMGMHMGALIMGIIGDGKRLEPATISDTVNTAARVEGLTKYFGASILLSDSTVNAIDDLSDLHLRKMGTVLMKGKKQELGIYECFDGDLPEMRELKLATLDAFNDGVKFYFDRDFTKAKGAFEYILSENPKDFPAEHYYKRTLENLQNGVPADWTGVETMLDK